MIPSTNYPVEQGLMEDCKAFNKQVVEAYRLGRYDNNKGGTTTVCYRAPFACRMELNGLIQEDKLRKMR